MEKLTMCRVCMIADVRMYSIVNTSLQETYEKLVDMPLETKDRRPLQVCYVCRARLHNCWRLRATCLHTQLLLTQMLDNNQVKQTASQHTHSLKINSPIIQFSVGTFEDTDADDAMEGKGPSGVMDYVHVKEEVLEDIEDDGTDQDVGLQSIGTEDTAVDNFYFNIQPIKTEDKYSFIVPDLDTHNIKLEHSKQEATGAPVPKKLKLTESADNFTNSERLEIELVCEPSNNIVKQREPSSNVAKRKTKDVNTKKTTIGESMIDQNNKLDDELIRKRKLANARLKKHRKKKREEAQQRKLLSQNEPKYVEQIPQYKLERRRQLSRECSKRYREKKRLTRIKKIDQTMDDTQIMAGPSHGGPELTIQDRSHYL